jgi:ADP-ribose pyrophosphatase YjhB (NUDIX family)
MIHDDAGRLLILRPSYKAGWTLPGGEVEADGESPWDACRRETFEECGLRVVRGRLACVDFLRPRPGRAGGVRFLFDCGALSADELDAIVLAPVEILEHRFVGETEARELLRGPVRRRVSASAGQRHCVYLEDGRRVEGVRG